MEKTLTYTLKDLRTTKASANEIFNVFDKITDRWTLPMMRSWKFIIMGKSGPTGKTWLHDRLRRHHLPAMELSEDIFDLVNYNDNLNHVIPRYDKRVMVIILNKPLDPELLQKETK